MVLVYPSPLPLTPLTISPQGFGEPRGHLSGNKIFMHTFIGPFTTAHSLLPTYYPISTERFSTVPSGRLKIVLGWPFQTVLVPVYRQSC